MNAQSSRGRDNQYTHLTLVTGTGDEVGMGMS